jgi:hypothetical protein
MPEDATMRRSSLKMVLFLCLIAGLTSIGFAQDAQPQGEQTGEAPPSSADMVTQGEGVVESGATLSTTVSGLVREATDDNDMMKVTCLNDKLTQIDGNLNTAQQHLAALRKATDAGVRAHEHTMIMVIGQKLEVLGQEAGQCVGQDLYETGETDVDTIIDESMLPFEDDPSVPPMVLPPSLPTLPPAISGMR